MQVPGLGQVLKQPEYGWYVSNPIPVPIFGGKACTIIVDGYADDDRKDEFHAAIANFLSGSPAVLREADHALFRYYKDFEEYWLDDGNPALKSADELWQRVRLGSQPMVTRRAYGDKGIYVTVECECAWEEEHGLQIVFKNGLKINKLGGYNGHLTNSDAFDNPALENVIYR
jgi:hypothetical protein